MSVSVSVICSYTACFPLLCHTFLIVLYYTVLYCTHCTVLHCVALCCAVLCCRLGASPGWGGGQRLLDIVGRSRALRLLGTAQLLRPEEALAVGLADAVLLPPSPSSPSLSSSLSSSALHPQSERGLSYVEQAVLFMEPFCSMPYPGAVKDMKLLVAGLSLPSCCGHCSYTADTDTCTDGTDGTDDTAASAASAGAGGHSLGLEKEIFQRRWGSKDNMTALSLKR